MSPKTYQEMVKSVKEDIYPPIQGHGQVSSPMDGSATFNEYFSHGSHVTTPNPSASGYFSSESQGEQLQLDTSSSIFTPAPSPMIAQSPMTPGILKPGTPGVQPSTPGVQSSTPSVQPSTPGTPGVQFGTPGECSEVEQALSMDGSEVNVVFNSHKSATGCRNWYGALFHVVPEVVKPQQNMKKEHIQIKLPEGGMLMVCSLQM